MQPDAGRLVKIAGIQSALIGLYDAPDASAFEPLVAPPARSSTCVFSFFKRWQEGITLHLSRENYGCGGAGRSLCGVKVGTREDLVTFLVDEEGLKPSHELMEEWLAQNRPYQQQYPHILIGPLRESQYDFLKSITFFVTPDQLGLLILGAQYRSRPSDPQPVLARFGSGCMQLLTMFEDLSIPQAAIGATDIAMRRYIPPDILAFTVTKAMFEQLCSLDKQSFLYKTFWRKLRKARHSK